jgi:hypothetical protein
MRADVIVEGEEMVMQIRRKTYTGIWGYWNDPDPKTRYANQFAVVFAVLLMFISFAIQTGWSFYSG